MALTNSEISALAHLMGKHLTEVDARELPAFDQLRSDKSLVVDEDGYCVATLKGQSLVSSRFQQLESQPDPLCEALNSGDGAYKP